MDILIATIVYELGVRLFSITDSIFNLTEINSFLTFIQALKFSYVYYTYCNIIPICNKLSSTIISLDSAEVSVFLTNTVNGSCTQNKQGTRNA